ncbi:MAG: hypothetical protein JWN57_3039 [Frankiales bacterium]|nr:hypothetical protein [Frankiales bacterium]
MRRVLPLVVATLVLLGLAQTASAAPAPRSGDSRGTFPAAGGPASRDYTLHVPAAVAKQPRRRVPLVVFLHGCSQSAADVAVGTRFSELADREGFVVLYPDQRRAEVGAPVEEGNRTGCWNWFLPAHQGRGAGEPATIAGMTRAVAARLPIDPKRIYVAGLSAGADMTTILGATYPDLYAAIAPVAGCAYLACADASGSAAHAAMGPRARVVPAFVVQGTADVVNNVAMGATAYAQWVGTNDLADDGKANGSLPLTSQTTYGTTVGAPGDPCVGSGRYPCAGGAAGLKGYPYTVLRHDDARGRSLLEAWVVHGANHAYTGGDPRGSYTDPTGPDVTKGIWDFFRSHPRR